MTVPTWPSDLPQHVLRDSYSEAIPDGRLFSQTDTGPGKSRTFNSAPIRPVQCRMRVNYDGKARLERFWNEDIGRGNLPFYIPDPVNDGQPMTDESGNVITDESGNVITIAAWWLAKFAKQGGPAFAPRGVAFTASFTLDVFP